MTYQAVLFSPDGDWVTDHERETIEQVWDAINDQGSRWFFYPLPFVTTSRGALTRGTQRIVAAPAEYDFLQGRAIATVRRILADNYSATIAARLEYLRGEIRSERISYSEIAELEGLAEHIAPDDVELLQWAGVEETSAV